MHSTRASRRQTRAALLAASLCVLSLGAFPGTGHADPLTQEDVLSSLSGSPSPRAKPTTKAERWREGKILGITGGSMLGAGYLFSAFFAGIMSIGSSFCGLGSGPCGGHRQFGHAVIPLVGPFVALHTARDGLGAGSSAGLVTLGLLQNVGLPVLIAGQVLRADMPSTSLMIGPVFSAKGAGVGLTGTF